MTDSVHQRLMNEAYAIWRKNRDWSTETFLMNLEPLQRAATVLGQLNQQVTNGGFSQWLGNRYGDGFHFLKFTLKEMDTDLSAKVLRLVELTMKWDPDCVEGDDTDRLDRDYYKINDAFMAECEKFLSKKVVSEVHAA